MKLLKYFYFDRFADNIENTYSLLMLILILHFSIVFCLSGFLCTIVRFSKTNSVYILMYICIYFFLFFSNLYTGIYWEKNRWSYHRSIVLNIYYYCLIDEYFFLLWCGRACNRTGKLIIDTITYMVFSN